MTFLDYYRENLDHIRNVAAEFAAEFPKIAARLELSEQNCQDPYVERLLEGAAFLSARVENKLDRGFPRLLETVLASVSPLTVSPVPSYAVLQLKPDANDERLKTGVTVPQDTPFAVAVEGVRTPCTFSLLSETPLSGATLSDARYLTRETAELGVSSPAALQIVLKAADGAGTLVTDDSLSFYVDLPEGEASMLLGQLVGDFDGVYVRRGGRLVRVEGARVEIPNYANRPTDGCGALHGLATLQRFFACPHLFKFFRVAGLGGRTSSETFELVIALRRREPLFIRSVGPETLRIDCAGAANVFARRADRTEYRGDYEHLIMPDRSAPRDYEVFRVLSVEAYDERNRQLFSACDTYGSESPDRFVPHRREHVVQPGSARSSYHGAEVFVALSGPDYESDRSAIRQFGAQLLCTNRDLPLLLRKDAPLTGPAGSPVASASFAVQPSAPRPPAVASAARGDWEKLSHVLFNLSSVLWKDATASVTAIRDLVRSYGSLFGEGSERLADGIRSLEAVPRTFRFVRDGAVYFENGWELRLALDETTCAGSGVFTFAAVLKELIFAYVPLGSCLELAVTTDSREEPYRWRTGAAQTVSGGRLG